MKSSYIIIGTIFAILSLDALGETTNKDLVKACVNQKKTEFINSHTSPVSTRGGVECPAADLVGFPPRERKHDRNLDLTLSAGAGRVFCNNPEVSYAVHSDNGGGRGNHSISNDKSTLTVPIYCRGAGLTQGRRWYDVTVSAKTCPIINEDLSLNFMLECAGAL